MTFPIVSLLASLLLFFPTSFSSAASYPASCPAEARTIVDAIGGCSAIDSSQYDAIYEKCCSKAVAPTPKPSPAPTPTPAPKPPSPPAEELSATFITLTSILFWGGLAYFIVRFIRKRKKKKDSASTVPSIK